MNLTEYLPSMMSAVASIAAAIAAFLALIVAKQSKNDALSSILASNHREAAVELSSVLLDIHSETKQLSEFSYRMWASWAAEIGKKDDPAAAGDDPRPLRHVIANGSEMLVNYAIDGSRRGSIRRSLLSPIVNGVGKLSDKEYKEMLSQADATYTDFETVFGIPVARESITSAPAFRWVCHQLVRRIKPQEWNHYWQHAWEINGWLKKYEIEYSKVTSVLQSSKERLVTEKLRLSHSVFPLDSNPPLSRKYNQVLRFIDTLLEDSDTASLKVYRNDLHKEDAFMLVVCSIAFAMYTGKVLDDLFGMIG